MTTTLAGSGDTVVAFFSWLLYLLIVIVLIMGIAAIWKYLKKN